MRQPERIYAVRRFRVGLVLVLGVPWLITAVTLPFGASLGFRAASELGYIVAILVPAVFAWRRPQGVAPWWLMFLLVIAAAISITRNRTLYVLLDVASIITLFVLVSQVHRTADA